MKTTTTRIATALASVGLAASLGLAGCSSSGDGADKATTTTKPAAPSKPTTTKPAADPGARACVCTG